MYYFKTVAALCAALFSSVTWAENMLQPFKGVELNCSIHKQTAKLELNTTNSPLIQVLILGGTGNTMQSQVSGSSSNRFQFMVSDLPLNITLKNGDTSLSYQAIVHGSFTQGAVTQDSDTKNTGDQTPQCVLIEKN